MRCFNKHWGRVYVLIETLKSGRKMRCRRKEAFRHQVRGSKARGIPFQFSYEEWVTWWEDNLGSDWLEKRGCKKGQYVMARYNDCGPYHSSNVKCILHTENTKEANNNVGEKHPRSKLRETEALFIKHSSISADELARRFNVSPITIRMLKRGNSWSHLK